MFPAVREFAKVGVRVNASTPQPVWHNNVAEHAAKTVQGSLSVTLPSFRRFGHSEEFAALALRITSDSVMNEKIIRLDRTLRM